MPSQIFRVTANKITSLLLADHALRFSSQSFSSVDEFEQAWNKKLTLATKLEIKYESIRSVTKEDQEEKIVIIYKTRIGFPSECEFSFTDQEDYAVFYTFMEKEQYFTKIHETLHPFKAVSRYLVGLLLTVGITIFSYFQAVSISNGTVDNSGDAKVRVFNYIIGMLGGKGILAVGTGISCYICYKIWTRYSAPPNRTKFVRMLSLILFASFIFSCKDRNDISKLDISEHKTESFYRLDSSENAENLFYPVFELSPKTTAFVVSF